MSLVPAQTYYTTNYAANVAGIIVDAIVLVVFVIPTIAGLWKVFQKAGKPGWAAIIPIYSNLVWLEVAGLPWGWIFFGLIAVIPVLGWLALIALSVYFSILMAQSFGRSAGFGWAWPSSRSSSIQSSGSARLCTRVRPASGEAAAPPGTGATRRNPADTASRATRPRATSSQAAMPRRVTRRRAMPRRVTRLQVLPRVTRLPVLPRGIPPLRRIRALSPRPPRGPRRPLSRRVPPGPRRRRSHPRPRAPPGPRPRRSHRRRRAPSGHPLRRLPGRRGNARPLRPDRLPNEALGRCLPCR